MLKGVDPLVGPDLLALLARMGHGDVLGVVDRNYPAHAAGVPVVEVPADLVAVLRAVLALMPLDQFQDAPVRHMLTDDGDAGPAVPDVRVAVTAAEGHPVGLAGIDRHDFYRVAPECFAIVRTAETRPYACLLLAKGVL